jgi:hypothetical protein
MSRRSFVRLLFALLIIGIAIFGCQRDEAQQDAAELAASLNRIAEAYVKLALAVGQHDANYVDAYYGPEAWREQAKAEKKPLSEIKQAAAPSLAELEKLNTSQQEESVQLRHLYLIKQLRSLLARVEMLEGKKFTFDEESQVLYDAVAPTVPETHFQEILDRIAKQLPPGNGTLVERLERFRKDFIIPPARLDTVFKVAIAEAQRRTKQHIELPAEESFVVEYVTNKSWSGYNWYKGNSHSVIQINTDLPIYIDRAVDLAAHEGYPGHHVYNTLLEKHLVKEKGWIEFSVYPLFSPQSLIAEGSANYGIEVAFPGEERLSFERDVLFPLAGLDPAKAEAYQAMQKLIAELSYARNEAARRYLNGAIDAKAAAAWQSKFALMSPERAQQSTRFIEQYRSYVINYNLGNDLVQSYIERKGGTAKQPQKRWEEFSKLLASPQLPSGLK